MGDIPQTLCPLPLVPAAQAKRVASENVECPWTLFLSTLDSGRVLRKRGVRWLDFNRRQQYPVRSGVFAHCDGQTFAVIQPVHA